MIPMERVYEHQYRARRWARYGDPQDEPACLPDELFESGDPIDDIDYSDRAFDARREDAT